MTNTHFPDPPLLCRQSNHICQNCDRNTSFSKHKYCRICCANREDNTNDRSIRDDIIFYHLLNTYNNDRGIKYFNKPIENDNNWVKRYLKVLFENNLVNFINYFNDPVISLKINNSNYFNSLN